MNPQTTWKERFDEKFTNYFGRISFDEIKTFIETTIAEVKDRSYEEGWATAKSMERERWKAEMTAWVKSNYRRNTQPLYAWVDAADLRTSLKELN